MWWLTIFAVGGGKGHVSIYSVSAQSFAFFLRLASYLLDFYILFSHSLTVDLE